MNFLFQTVLGRKYHCIPVSDVYQGVNELKKRGDDITLIIIDLDYHTQENWDFIQHIQTSGLYQETPIVVLTSEKQNEKLDLSKVYNLFYKPFSPMEILSKIDELVYKNYIKLT